MMQRSAAQVGAVIPGWRDIRQLGRINVVRSRRGSLPGRVRFVAGIKPVKPEHIDLAIVYAASILAEESHAARCLYDMSGEQPQPAGQGR